MQGRTDLIPLTALQPIKGWEEYFQHGEGYLKTARGAHQKAVPSFTPEILYNLIAMAIEKFVMAALMRHGALPYNHTMGDLVEAMENTFPGRMGEIGEGLLALDKYQEICDLDAFNIRPPTQEEIPAMLKLAGRLRDLVVNELL
ncbi:hypothetical protein [Candidatus Electronema sp. PJ]|uniref:hypothetical protein n=1 Tax=Candidatus Electronema sp. PJ TaxID=3401572 RepID=UPI003AA90DCF